MNEKDKKESVEKDSVMDHLIAACAIAAAIIPLAGMIPFRLNWTTLFDWVVNLLCVAAFYMGSKSLLQKLGELEMLEGERDDTFHRIRTSVGRLSVVGLSTMAVAWLISNVIGH